MPEASRFLAIILVVPGVLAKAAGNASMGMARRRAPLVLLVVTASGLAAGGLARLA